MNRYAMSAATALLAISATAWSLDCYLSQDLGVHGVFHLCEYSNGKQTQAIRIGATTLCPLSYNFQ